jgi:hypothetical protein
MKQEPVDISNGPQVAATQRLAEQIGFKNVTEVILIIIDMKYSHFISGTTTDDKIV